MLAPSSESNSASVFAPRATIDADGTVEGYASLFGELDQARDMMMRGAFAETLAVRGIRRVPMLFQHNPSEPVGIWLELREDHRGLFARGRLIPEVARGRELLSLLRAGAIDGLSIGFRTSKARIDPRTRIRRIYAVDLWEISIVTFPMLAGARVRAVKRSQARTRAEQEWARAVGKPGAAGGLPCRIGRRALKYGFNAGQLRVPRGHSDGGQWADQGSLTRPRIRLAGEIPTNDKPQVPKERPPTSRERTAILKEVAKRLGQVGGAISAIAEAGSWIRTYSPVIESYRDPPKTLNELQQAVSTPAAGYDTHHIVEQAQAEAAGFSRGLIDAPENLVRIPRMKHHEINGWYQRANRDFDGLTPREYLSGRNWDVRRAVGLEALRRHGVLK
jgi:hypothetical protein